MVNWNIIIVALCLAFCQVRVLKFGSVKPFSCVTCMTGWYALAVALIVNGWHWGVLVYLPVGVFVGALYEGIKMRWL